MIFLLTYRVVCSVSAFVYPGYASYKTLAQRPASEEDLERWLMYWSVLGCLVGVEYVAEWMISWIPFYYFIKTLFLLYISLPQTQGSTYLYQTHLRPFFQSHENQIDQAIAELKNRVYVFFQAKARAIWEQLSSSAGMPTNATATLNEGQGEPTEDAAGGPGQLVGTLWRSYGPGLMASGALLLSKATPAAASSAFTPTPNPSGFAATTSRQTSSASKSTLERRRQLEAELAALDASSNASDSPTSLSAHDRSLSTGRFEEIELPSDVEGYDTGEGHSYDRPPQQKRSSSWFPWAGAAPAGSGYEHVKSD